MKTSAALKRAAICLVFIVGVVASTPAAAAPILGGQLTYGGGSVTVTTLPVTSGFTSVLGLYSPALTLLQALVTDEPPGVSVTFNPSVHGIMPGSELIFGVRVVETSQTFFIGPASRNPDGVFHATTDGPKTIAPYGVGIEVGFEDLFGGGDQDYDDNRFFFQGSVQQLPEPATLALLGLGLAGLVARRRQ